MVQARVVGNPEQAAHRSSLRIGRTEHHPADTAVDDCAGAHGARLEGDVQRAIVEAPLPDDGGGIAKRKHLRVRSGIAGELAFVVAGGNDCAVARDDRSNRDIAVQRGGAGLAERLAHHRRIGINRDIYEGPVHGRSFAGCADDSQRAAEHGRSAEEEHRHLLRAALRSDGLLNRLVVGELRRGIELIRRRDEHAATVLQAWLESMLRDFSDRVLPVTIAISQRWALISVPDPVPVVDGLLAATAIEHGLTLVTRNTGDVMRTGVEHVDPFTPP